MSVSPSPAPILPAAVPTSSIPPASDTRSVDLMRVYWRSKFPVCGDLMVDAHQQFNDQGTHHVRASDVPLLELHQQLHALFPRQAFPLPQVTTWSMFRTGALVIKEPAGDLIERAFIVPMRQRYNVFFQLVNEGVFRYTPGIDMLVRMHLAAKNAKDDRVEMLASGISLARTGLEKALMVLLGSYPAQEKWFWEAIHPYFRLWNAGYAFIGVTPGGTPILIRDPLLSP